MNRLLVLLLCALPLAGLAEQGGERIQAWLHKMHKASNTLNYEGTFVYQQNKQLSAMRIIHAYDEHGEKERLISLDHDGRQVIRREDKVTCVLPERGSVVVEKTRTPSQFPPLFPVDINQLGDQYRFKLGNRSMVAGERCQEIIIEPRDNLRYGHRLWVDEDTGLLLKTQLLDENGRVLEQFMFTEIRFYDTIPESKLEPDIDGDQYVWYEAKHEEQPATAQPSTGRHSDWAFSDLPDGFAHSMQRQHRMAGTEQPVEHLVVSDGLASVSVFIEDASKGESNLRGASHMGAVNAFGRKLGNHYVTAIGEVPQTTVKMISKSVVYQPQSP